MNARYIKSLALALMLGAFGLVLYAFHLGSKPAPSTEVVMPDPHIVMVTTRSIAAGEQVEEDDVAEQRVRVAPPSAYKKPEEVVGRDTAMDLEAGEVLLHRNFLEPGHFHAELGSDERAIAVKVDEVIGLGGLTEPGDRVDVLAYFANRGRSAQAQLLLEDVRILAVGSRTEKAGESEKVARARSAVLAVSVTDVPQLMLAANTGRLRLALRPGPGDTGTSKPARIATLDALLKGRTKSKRTGTTPAMRRKVEILRGDQRDWSRP